MGSRRLFDASLYEEITVRYEPEGAIEVALLRREALGYHASSFQPLPLLLVRIEMPDTIPVGVMDRWLRRRIRGMIRDRAIQAFRRDQPIDVDVRWGSVSVIAGIGIVTSSVYFFIREYPRIRRSALLLAADVGSVVQEIRSLIRSGRSRGRRGTRRRKKRGAAPL